MHFAIAIKKNDLAPVKVECHYYFFTSLKPFYRYNIQINDNNTEIVIDRRGVRFSKFSTSPLWSSLSLARICL